MKREELIKTKYNQIINESKAIALAKDDLDTLEMIKKDLSKDLEKYVKGFVESYNVIRKMILTREGCGPSEWTVYSQISSMMFVKDSIYCWPNTKTIAYETKMSEKTVIKSIKNLEENGFIIVDKIQIKGTQYKSKYYFPYEPFSYDKNGEGEMKKELVDIIKKQNKSKLYGMI